MNKCHYCSNLAKHNVVWLKDKKNRPARIILPHCGCNLLEAIQKFWPNPVPIIQGIDYIFEQFEDLRKIIPKGNGLTVTYQIKLDNGHVVEVSQSKHDARKLAKEIDEEACHPEPTCNDATDHWSGHCACR